MKENREVTDTNVEDIEEAIERLEYIDRTYSCNNYYSIWDLKCIEILLSDYKRVLKENEELLEVKVSASANNRILELEKENEELKEENEYNKILLDMNNNFTIDKKTGNYKWNVIEIQKVKDKIEELKQEKGKYGNCLIEMYEDELVNRDIKILQELIEEREEK